MNPGEVINRSVSDYYAEGPQDAPGPAGNIIAALGWSGFWISEDVNPLANDAVRCLQNLTDEIAKISLDEWAGSNMPRQRQVEEVRRVSARALRLVERAADVTLSQAQCTCSPLTRYADAPHEQACELSRPK